MHRLLLYCTLLLTTLALASSSLAEPPRIPSIDGTVVDASGAVVPGAQIRLIRFDNSSSAITAQSDSQGSFHLAAAEGDYRLTVERGGFSRSESVVHVGSAPSITVTVRLAMQQHSETIEVTADNGYRTDVATSAARMPLAVIDTPQSLDVVPQELIRAKNITSMKGALEAVPGVSIQLGEGRRDQVSIRGFAATNDNYVNGVRDDATYYRDLSNTERIEVLKGPAGVLYGRGSSGGLVNRVTKQPQLESTVAELAVTGGSYDSQRYQGDVDTSLRRNLGLRITGAWEDSNSQRHFFNLRRYAFSPSLLYRPSDKTSILVQVERLRDQRLPDRGIPAVNGLPAFGVGIGTYYGYAGTDFLHSAVTSENLDVQHETENGWHLRENFRYAGYLTNFYNTFINSVSGTNVLRGQYNAQTPTKNVFNQVEGWRSQKVLGLSHLLLVGVEYGRQTQKSLRATGTAAPVSLYDPEQVAPVTGAIAQNNRFFGQTTAVYAQDKISVLPKLDVLAGIRFDNYKQELDDRTAANVDLERTDNQLSPRVGVVYHLVDNATLYGNFSRSFQPSGEGMTLATNSAELEPETTKNYEIGSKFSSLNGRLMTTVSLFRLDRTNIKTTDPSDPTKLILAGEQRTNGAEVSFEGSLARNWMVYAGYAWMDARIVSSNSSQSGVLLQGKRPGSIPLHSGSLWSNYMFKNGFGFGGGVIANADRYASNDDLAILPGFTRVDASVFFRRSRYDVAINLQNLTNKTYAESAQSDYQIFPAAPISGSMTVRYRFH